MRRLQMYVKIMYRELQGLPINFLLRLGVTVFLKGLKYSSLEVTVLICSTVTLSQ